jgi:hypothetical protein
MANIKGINLKHVIIQLETLATLVKIPVIKINQVLIANEIITT